MRFLFLAPILFIICLSCNDSTKSNKNNYCFILRDFDGTNYVFLLKDENICYSQNFLRTLPTGFMVMNSQISFEDYDSATILKIPNSKRNKLIYSGDLDKYYIAYFAKVKAFAYKIKNSNVASIKLNISNREQSLPVYEQVNTDSLIITGKIN